ncbi:MAG: tRNA-specific 2-thiouridylase [Parcubacteria group bacterium LiPW_15]|nr:MAG: tRNA-specific 2-thiouridylase [Parcubacteria group bacterium LiPW_15]
MKKAKKKVFVGMSGGVDSSVAAYLLKKQGYDVVGVFIRGYNIDNCQDRDAEDARRVAEHLSIPFYTWDFEKEYKRHVVDYMVAGYKKGLTPNPDVMCNREIKFGIFFDRAMRLGADFVATGHYVKKKNNSLAIAADKNKDQSYFLWTLTAKQIEKSLFPIGDYLKPEVRKIAKKAGISTAEKKDSQGICFLGMVSIKDFLKSYLPEKKGAVLNLKGEKVGEHFGAHFYTIGQRGGVGNLKHEKGQKNHVPLYVAKKDVKKNILVVAEGSDNPALYEKSVYLTDVNFNYSPSTIHYPLEVSARVRYRQPLFPAVLVKEKGGWRLDFKKSQKFVAPGQSAVIYLPSEASAKEGVKNDIMLGGGVIE